MKIELHLKLKQDIYLELLTPGTMKSLGSTKNKITKDKNGENVPHLEITEVVLVHCNIASKFKSFIYICSKYTIWSIVRNFSKDFFEISF